jgi:hypothetical protein
LVAPIPLEEEIMGDEAEEEDAKEVVTDRGDPVDEADCDADDALNAADAGADEALAEAAPTEDDAG